MTEKGFVSTSYVVLGAVIALAIGLVIFYLIQGDVMTALNIAIGKLIEF